MSRTSLVSIVGAAVLIVGSALIAIVGVGSSTVIADQTQTTGLPPGAPTSGGATDTDGSGGSGGSTAATTAAVGDNGDDPTDGPATTTETGIGGPGPSCGSMQQLPITADEETGGGLIYTPPASDAALPIVVLLHQGGARTSGEAVEAAGWCDIEPSIVLVVPEGNAHQLQFPGGLWWAGDDGRLSPSVAESQTGRIVAAVEQAARLGGDLNQVILVGVDNGAAMALRLGCVDRRTFDFAVVALVDPMLHVSALADGTSPLCNAPAFDQTIVVTSRGELRSPGDDRQGYLVRNEAVSWILESMLGCETAGGSTPVGRSCDRPVAVETYDATSARWHADALPPLLSAMIRGEVGNSFPDVGAKLARSIDG